MIFTTTHVDLGDRSYSIVLANSYDGLGAAVRALHQFSQVAIIADAQVAALYGGMVMSQFSGAGIPAQLFSFPEGEPSKNNETFMMLQSHLIDMKMDRKGLVVALGGGVTGDMAGFVAASYMRGIPFIQLPTTILSLVDSSVGGKTGINHPHGKNMIGAFHQPLLVWGNLATLATLSQEEFTSGMAEVVKHGIISDRAYFSSIEDDCELLLALDHEALARMVAGSCRIKADVVVHDEREAGRRAILNFGHTAAHAFEALTNYTGYRHGEAVAIGMVVACRLAERVAQFPEEETARIIALLKRVGLPTTFGDLDSDTIIHSMFGDKKTEKGTLRFVLPTTIGSVDIVKVTDMTAIHDALNCTRHD